MSGIIKRQQAANFAQIPNHVLQSLSDLRAIGLIAHLLSMPSDWAIRKTHLYSKFGRAAVTNGIAVLEEHKLWVHFEFRDGSRNIHSYCLSGLAFTDAEVSRMIHEIHADGFQVKKISEPFEHLLTDKKEANVCGNSIADSQQLNLNSTKSTVENEQLSNKQNQRKRKQIHTNQRTIVNSQGHPPTVLHAEEFRKAATTACNEYYPLHAPGRWSKQAWQTLTETFIKETIDSRRYQQIPPPAIPTYVQASILKMVRAHDQKTNQKPMKPKIIHTRPVPFYDWVTE